MKLRSMLGRVVALAVILCVWVLPGLARVDTASAASGIAFRSQSSAVNGITSSLTVPAPSGASVDDVLVASIDVLQAATITAPNGWKLERVDTNSAGSRPRQALYTHAVTAGEPGSYTWTFSAPAAAIGGILDYTGVDTTSPVDATSGQTSADIASVTAPSLSTTAPNEMLLAAFGLGSQAVLTAPSGMTQRLTVIAVNTPGNRVTDGLDDQPLPTTGPTGTRTLTIDHRVNGIGQLLALKPRTGQPPPPSGGPPPPPSGIVQVGSSGSSVSLQWNPSVGSAQYTVYLNGTVAGTTGSTAFTIPGLACGTSYPVAVDAVDAAGAHSGQTSISAATTACAPGTVIEYQVPIPALPSAITAGPDGNLWFTMAAASYVGKVTPYGAVALYPTPTPGNGGGITSGPDGNVWFVETAAHQIGRITPAGTITEFPLPSTSVGGAVIVQGPDGNLWFTETRSDRIGRITPAGVVTEFQVPTAGSSPHGLTLGPDGNLWFTEITGNRIGRITPTGVITEFPLPTPNSGPDLMTAGPDGNLWFTEDIGQIGRMTTAGNVTEFALSPAGVHSGGITRGPDGNVWFTESNADKIGRITPTGAITTFPVLTPAAGPDKITAGPDGNLWFTEHDSDRVGRITP